MGLTPRAGSSPAFGTNHIKPSRGGFYFKVGDNTILSFKKIFAILFISSLIGILVNFLNPDGLPLIREKVELNWVSDSLLFDTSEDAVVIPEDSIVSEPAGTEIQKEKEIEKKNTPEKVENLQTTKTDEPNKEEKELQAFSEPKAVTLEQAYKLFNNGVTFIDARDEGDFLAGHISNSINIPFDDFDNHKQKLDQLSKDKPMVIYCGGTDCDLSHLLANLLFEKGYKQVYVFFGGWYDWLDAKYPVVYPEEE